jgi:hypothetical protein
MGAEEIRAVVLMVIFIAMVFLAAWLSVRRQITAENPHLVIRRCRRMIAAVRTELASLPASREVHDLDAEAVRAEAACIEREKELIA